MLDRVGRRFHLRPQRLDTAYGEQPRLLKWLVDRKIAPHIPVWDKSARSDGTLSRADFVFDRERNVYKVESCCTPPEQSSTAVASAIAPQSAIAISVLSSCGVVPTRLRGRFPAICMKMPATSPAHWPRLQAYEQSRRERKKVDAQSIETGESLLV